MNCENVRQKISDYIELLLPENELRKFEEHIKTCSSCRNELEFIETIKKECSNLESLEPAPSVWQKICSEIEESKNKLLEEKISSPLKDFLKLISSKPVFAPSLGVLLFVTVLMSFYFIKQDKLNIEEKRTEKTVQDSIEIVEKKESLPLETKPTFVIESIDPSTKKGMNDGVIEVTQTDSSTKEFVITMPELEDDIIMRTPSNYVLPVISTQTMKDSEF